MSTPVFTVIIPFYNRPKTLGRAIESVLSQTYSDFELVLIDDCSTDSSLSIAKRFSDPRIVIASSEKNAGPANARNTGISFASGKYISFLDSDDVYAPDFLDETFRKFQSLSPSVGFIWTGVSYQSENNGSEINEIPVWVPKIMDTPYKTFLYGIHIGTNSGLTVKREVFEKVGLFDSQMKAAEDTDFFLRATQVFEFDCIPKTLIHIYKENQDRVSRQYNNIASAYEIILAKHIQEIRKVKALRIKYFYKMLWLEYHTEKKEKARGYFKDIIKDSPFHLKSWAVFLLFEILGYTWGRKIHLKLTTD
jgi:glycosyltransferase involved in cell wall biosynthesis